jgi:shikimate kinase
MTFVRLCLTVQKVPGTEFGHRICGVPFFTLTRGLCLIFQICYNDSYENSAGGQRLRLNFILIGSPNSGKTTLGKKAAALLGMGFYDIDTYTTERILSKYRNPSAFQFRDSFHAAEKAVVRRIAKKAANAIIATGAETVLSSKNVQILRKYGLFIHIKRDPARILEEAQKHIITRPGKPDIRDANELAVYLYRDVMHEYEKLADFTLKNDDDEEAGLAKLVEIIQNWVPG